MKIPRGLSVLGLVLVVGFFFLSVLVPVSGLFWRIGSFAAARTELLDPGVLRIARITVEQAAWSTFFALAVGLPLGLFVWRSPLSRIFLSLPYGIPTVVVAVVALRYLGRSGLDIAYSFRAVVFTHAFLNIPWVALLITQSRAQVPRAELEAGASLGASRVGIFKDIVWPYLGGALGSAAAQVFGLCCMSFAIVLLLGGGPPVETLETAIYSRIRYSQLDLSGAMACALWELLICMGPWLGLLVFRRNRRVLEIVGGGGEEVSRSARAPFGASWIAAFFVIPYLILPVRIFQQGISAGPFLSDLSQPLLISLEIAMTVTFLTLVITLGALVSGSRRSIWIPFLASLPAGISALVLGLGFWLAYGRWIDPFDGSFLAIVIIQAALLTPLALRMLWPVAQMTQVKPMEAALTLGASPIRAFWSIEWPRWRAPFLSAMALVGAASLGEVAVVSLFYSEKLIPVSFLMTRWAAQYRFADAEALGGVLFVLSAGAVAVFGRYAWS